MGLEEREKYMRGGERRGEDERKGKERRRNGEEILEKEVICDRQQNKTWIVPRHSVRHLIDLVARSSQRRPEGGISQPDVGVACE